MAPVLRTDMATVATDATALPPESPVPAPPAARPGAAAPDGERVDWLRVLPFIALHAACLGVFAVGVGAAALWVAAASYALRAFAVSAFYHRGFSHGAFRMRRAVRVVFAALAAAATQRGPLWWAAHHRMHHAHADTDADPHSAPRGFWWAHAGWFLTRRHYRTPLWAVRDLARYPELRWLNRFDLAAPVAYGAAMFGLGEALAAAGADTGGWQMLVWGYVLPTVALMHVTFMVNSVAHRAGSKGRPFETRDRSRNLGWLALLSMGEGWHNNHHRYAASARLGFRWWQLDLAWAGLRLLEMAGLVSDLRHPPPALRRGSAPCASR